MMSKRLVCICIAIMLLAACKSPPVAPPPVIVTEPEPEPDPIEVADLQFTVTSIAILQDILINTRFRLKLTVENPNTFPIHIVVFNYTLYGDGRLWTSGTQTDFPVIPAESVIETSLEFEMNFINMRRQLLDDIIAMRQVRYRFIGNAAVETDIPHLPRYYADFDLSGISNVIR